MCCDPVQVLEKHELPDGICEDCGEETIDGMAVEGCNHSPVECPTCNFCPCDQSC